MVRKSNSSFLINLRLHNQYLADSTQQSAKFTAFWSTSNLFLNLFCNYFKFLCVAPSFLDHISILDNQHLKSDSSLQSPIGSFQAILILSIFSAWQSAICFLLLHFSNTFQISIFGAQQCICIFGTHRLTDWTKSINQGYIHTIADNGP